MEPTKKIQVELSFTKNIFSDMTGTQLQKTGVGI
jgi:hypothetical protein